MSGWITSAAAYQACLNTVGSFLIPDAELPSWVAMNGVQVVGFMDECSVRQSSGLSVAMNQFAAAIGEPELYFHWRTKTPDLYKAQHGVYPTYFFEATELDGRYDLVDIQVGAQAALSYPEWLLFSKSSRWAIYGDRYNSELCLFLSRDELVSAAMLRVFPSLITDPRMVSQEIWSTPANVDHRRKYEASFIDNYLPMRGAL